MRTVVESSISMTGFRRPESCTGAIDRRGRNLRPSLRGIRDFTQMGPPERLAARSPPAARSSATCDLAPSRASIPAADRHVAGVGDVAGRIPADQGAHRLLTTPVSSPSAGIRPRWRGPRTERDRDSSRAPLALHRLRPLAGQPRPMRCASRHQRTSHEPTPGHLAGLSYLTRSKMLKIGMYKATIMPPMIDPRTTIIKGSMSAVSCSVVASTSWS